MTAITIITDENAPDGRRFRAAVGAHQADGKTVGEALDAVAPQLGQPGERFLLVSTMRPDRFFTAEQTKRLTALVAKAHTGDITPDERTEMETLIEAELDASTRRAAALADALGL